MGSRPSFSLGTRSLGQEHKCEERIHCFKNQGDRRCRWWSTKQQGSQGESKTAVPRLWKEPWMGGEWFSTLTSSGFPENSFPAPVSLLTSKASQGLMTKGRHHHLKEELDASAPSTMPEIFGMTVSSKPLKRKQTWERQTSQAVPWEKRKDVLDWKVILNGKLPEMIWKLSKNLKNETVLVQKQINKQANKSV